MSVVVEIIGAVVLIGLVIMGVKYIMKHVRWK